MIGQLKIFINVNFKDLIMIKNIFILFIALFSYNLFSAEKITVAVLPFSSVNGEEEGDTLASMFDKRIKQKKGL